MSTLQIESSFFGDDGRTSRLGGGAAPRRPARPMHNFPLLSQLKA